MLSSSLVRHFHDHVVVGELYVMTLQGRKRRSQAITDKFARSVSDVRISRETVQVELKSFLKQWLGWAGASFVLRELTSHTNLPAMWEVDLNVMATNPHNAPALKPRPLAQQPTPLLAPPTRTHGILPPTPCSRQRNKWHHMSTSWEASRDLPVENMAHSHFTSCPNPRGLPRLLRQQLSAACRQLSSQEGLTVFLNFSAPPRRTYRGAALGTTHDTPLNLFSQIVLDFGSHNQHPTHPLWPLSEPQTFLGRPKSTTELYVQGEENACVCHRLNTYLPWADTTSYFGVPGSHEVHLLLFPSPLFLGLHLHHHPASSWRSSCARQPVQRLFLSSPPSDSLVSLHFHQSLSRTCGTASFSELARRHNLRAFRHRIGSQSAS